VNSKQTLLSRPRALAMLILLSETAFAAEPLGLPDEWSDGYVNANGIRINYYHATTAPEKNRWSLWSTE
jgi:hypothetical protein